MTEKFWAPGWGQWQRITPSVSYDISYDVGSRRRADALSTLLRCMARRMDLRVGYWRAEAKDARADLQVARDAWHVWRVGSGMWKARAEKAEAALRLIAESGCVFSPDLGRSNCWPVPGRKGWCDPCIAADALGLDLSSTKENRS